MTDLKNRRRWHRFSRAATAGVLTVTAIGVVPVGPTEAATTLPQLTFVAATPAVTVERYVMDDRVLLSWDLGLHIIAGKDPLEIWAHRSGYDRPIVAELVVIQNGRKQKVALPADAVTDFTGLKDFTKITIADAAGRAVASYTTAFCGGTRASARTRPDAPATTPYPARCGGTNPFTVGAVWGVQAGWDAAVADRPNSLDLPPGRYTATATVNPAYRRIFRVSPESATVRVGITVVNGDPRKAAALAGSTDRHDRQLPGHQDDFRSQGTRPPAVTAAPPPGPKPDLRSLPAWGLSLEQGTDEQTGKPNGRWYVSFGATVWNGGTSPLLVDGFRRNGTELMDAYQYFFDATGKQVGFRPAGTFEWDDREGHKHWHFTDFVRYDLLDADQKVAVRSGKAAFCLANNDAVDYTITNAKWRPESTDLSTSCGTETALAVRVVLDIGNGDTYDKTRPGQSFEVTDLPNGLYYIQVLANPERRLSELNTTNNSALRAIVLGGTPNQRTLTVPPVHNIDG
jgi:hypothetical protein